MILRWVGTGLAVVVLLLAGTQLSCLAGDVAGQMREQRPAAAAAPDLPVHFEVDHTAPGLRPVLTR